MAFKKATARQGKVRMALVGGPGTGKTWTSLTFATALAGPEGAIAFIDTEHGSASKYASEEPGDGLFTFDVEEPSTFDPRQLLGFIDEAAAANYAVLCVDSYTHYWSGQEGMLEMVGGNFNRWKDVTPIERKVISKLLTFPGHVIVCMRAKTDYVKVQGRNGKEQMQKVGVKPDQREAVEFEFDVVAYMGREGAGVTMSIEKTRCPALHGEVFTNPTGADLEPLRQWLNRGEPDDTDYWTSRVKNATDMETLTVIYNDMNERGVFTKWKALLSARRQEVEQEQAKAAKTAARWSQLGADSPVEEWERHIDKTVDVDALEALVQHAETAGRFSELEKTFAVRRQELTEAP